MILEGKTSLSMQRANVGIMFRFNAETGEPLGEVLVDWGKVPALIDKLTEWQTMAAPKHYHMVLDPAAIGASPADLGG